MNKIQVVAAIFQGENGFLAFRRSAGKSAAGKWEFPGGKVEEGESPQRALQREIAEELACEIEVFELLDRTTTRVGELEIDLSCYFVSAVHAFPTESTDHDQIKWLTRGELMTVDWALPDLPAVHKLLGRS
jgi:8-oxo-dGTP diphosphatase